MTPTSTTLTRPAPVPFTIGLRPPTEATGTLPVPVSTTPIPEGTFQPIDDLDVDVAESAVCAARPATTSPTRPGYAPARCPDRTLAGAAHRLLRETAPCQ